jgi:hypothetical protein
MPDTPITPDDWDETLQERASNGVSMTSVDGTSVTNDSVEEMLKLDRHFATEDSKINRSRTPIRYNFFQPPGAVW